MIRAMKRVYLLYTQDRQDQLLQRLQQLGVLHIEESKLTDHSETATTGHLAEQRRRIENLLIKARGTLDLFSEVDPKLLHVKRAQITQRKPQELSQAFRQQLESLEGRLKSLVSERRELRDRQAAGERFRELLQASEGLLKALPTDDAEIIAMIGVVKGPALRSEIESTLKAQIPGKFKLATQELTEDRVEFLVSVQSEYAPAVREYLEAKHLRPVALPPHIEDGFAEGIAQLRVEQTSIPKRLHEIERELRDLAKQHATRMVTLTTALENRLAQLDAATHFGYTRYTLVISGWVPTDEFGSFQATLRREFPGIILQQDPVKYTHEDIPVALQQRSWAKPYQLFLNAFGTPKHGTVDPVPYISVFFPIFFGLILGDIGYGLIILTLALWGRAGFPGVKLAILKRLPGTEGGRAALRILRDGGVSAVLFGLIFGEFFGLEFEQLGIHGWGPWPFSRLHHAIDLLIFTVALGAVQVLMGFAFGIVMALRHRDMKHLMVKIGLVIALFAISLIVGSLMKIVPEGMTPGVILFVIALPFLMYGGGAVVIIEALSPFIHVLSYARLMGFAVAGVVLATLINSLVGGLGAMGNVVLGVILGAIVALVLHTFNFVLHVFEGTIQSARLQWVEFFQKFILEHLGGKPYRPFREKALSIEES
jgi:V/A-type H+-transporting ATPase subunit I